MLTISLFYILNVLIMIFNLQLFSSFIIFIIKEILYVTEFRSFNSPSPFLWTNSKSEIAERDRIKDVNIVNG